MPSPWAVFTYAKGGHKWVYGGEVMRRNHPYRNTGIPVVQYTGEAGYYRNFFSCPGKVVLLNIGLSGLMGYESVNGGKRLLDDGAGLKKHGSFIYGGAVTLEAEVCLTDRLSLGLRLRERVLWGRRGRTFPYPIRNFAQLYFLTIPDSYIYEKDT